MSLRIKKDDKVKVIAGKDKGSIAKVLSVNPTTNRAIVEHVNMIKRHVKSRGGQQPGGVSGALRRLVEHATREQEPQATARLAKEATDRFMQVMAGDLAGYEEVSRALYRGERERFETLVATWPRDVREHIQKLAADAWAPEVAAPRTPQRQKTP